MDGANTPGKSETGGGIVDAGSKPMITRTRRWVGAATRILLAGAIFASGLGAGYVVWEWNDPDRVAARVRAAVGAVRASRACSGTTSRLGRCLPAMP